MRYDKATKVEKKYNDVCECCGYGSIGDFFYCEPIDMYICEGCLESIEYEE